MELAPPNNRINVWTIDDIENFEINPDLYVAGNGHIMKGKDRLHLIVGYAGVGKSRAANFLAYCGATGRQWFDYEIKNEFKTLFIQTENGRARLKHDYENLFDQVRDKVFFTDLPTGARFDAAWFRQDLKNIIQRESIGVIIIDPWTNVAPDLNHKEYNRAVELVLDCMPEDDALCPAIVVVAHLRKPDPASKNKRGSELMHEVMGSQTLTSRSRFVLVMERANPRDPKDDRVIVTCAKNNDSLDAPRSCHRRGKVIFEEVSNYDWEQHDQSGDVGCPRQYALSDIVDLVEPSEQISSAEWKQRAMDALGISSSRFYDFQGKAVRMERIVRVAKGLYKRPSD